MLDIKIRNVLARYYEDPQDSLNPTGDNVPFLDYLKQKAPLPEEDGSIPGDTNPGMATYNPYSIPDPSSLPKEIGDSPVFVRDIPTRPVYNKPKVFEEDSPLGQWWKSRRQDWTTPPSQQQPAISIDRRFASSVKTVISQYLLSEIPLALFDQEYDEIGLQTKTAASLSQVLNKDYHYKNDKKIQRAERVAVSWTNEESPKETKSGKFVWSARSPGSDEAHTVILQFHQSEDAASKTARYADLPVKLSCSCESFLWYGAQWYAVQEGYMFLPALRRSVMPPKAHTQISRVRAGKGLNFRICKHILAVYDEIENWKLETEYKDLVKVTPLSKIMNPKEFERLLGVPFSYQSIKETLQRPSPMTPKMRNFYRYKVQGTKPQKKALSKLDRWYFTKYRKMSQPKKLQALEAYVNHPEEIFYIILRDAIVNKGRIPDDYIKQGVLLMSKVIDPQYGFKLQKGDLDAVPGATEAKQEGVDNVPEEQKKVGEGTGITAPEAVQQYRRDREEAEEDEKDKEK